LDLFEVDGVSYGGRRKLLNQNQSLMSTPLRLDDVPSVQRIGGHPLVAPMLASVGTPWPKAAVQAWITARQYRGKPGFCAAIVLPERTVIGVAGLGPNLADGPCSCVYFIDPWHSGLGYASDAMGAFLAYFMRKFDLCEVAQIILTTILPVVRFCASWGFKNLARDRVNRRQGLSLLP
jgi:RimJ/RimL family protein N-acetyltransferase